MAAERNRTKQFKIRMPPALHARLYEQAKGSHRTLSTEIVSRLERSLDREALLNDVRQALHESRRPLYPLEVTRAEPSLDWSRFIVPKGEA